MTLCPDCNHEMKVIEILDKTSFRNGKEIYGQTYKSSSKCLLQCPKCKTITTEWRLA